MPSLKEVKGRITSVVSTQQITKAMKMVAASKLRRAQDRLLQMRPYAEKLNQILTNVSASLGEETVVDYAVKREVNKVLIVVLSSDKGLCGGFNSTLFRLVRENVQGKYSQQNLAGNVTIMPVGVKSQAFFSKRDYKVDSSFKDLMGDPSFENVREAASFAMEAYKNGTYDQVILAYNEFKNVATQILRFEQFLPIEPIDPVESEEKVKNVQTDYIYEPSKEYIIEELIPQSLKVQFFKAVLESNAAEQGARMTAMDKATENAGELLKELRLQYNRTRQAAITKEILEIVAGAEALGG